MIHNRIQCLQIQQITAYNITLVTAADHQFSQHHDHGNNITFQSWLRFIWLHTVLVSHWWHEHCEQKLFY